MGTPSSTSTETPSRIVSNPMAPPGFQVPLAWVWQGIRRMDAPIIGALIAAWTGLPFAMWLAAVGFFVGGILGFIGVTAHSSSLGIFGTVVGSPGGGLFGAALGAVLGTAGGFLLIYYFLATHPLQLIGALIGGTLASVVIFWVMVTAEPYLMHVRGYRKPSRRERAKIDPLLLEVGAAMGLDFVPDYWINESKKPGAWMHLQSFVITRGILGDYDASENPPTPDLDDASIAAIIAHELTHWERADVVGLTMIAACFFPFVVIVNGIQWIRLRAEWTGLILWCFFWPIWVCNRLVIVPLIGYTSRLYEFQADARAASLGDKYRLGLRRALKELEIWERPRTGWEEVLAATHPPIELRLEALEERNIPAMMEILDADPRTTRPRSATPQPAVVVKPPAKPRPRPSKPKPKPASRPAPVVPEDPPADDDGQWSA